MGSAEEMDHQGALCVSPQVEGAVAQFSVSILWTHFDVARVAFVAIFVTAVAAEVVVVVSAAAVAVVVVEVVAVVAAAEAAVVVVVFPVVSRVCRPAAVYL